MRSNAEIVFFWCVIVLFAVTFLLIGGLLCIAYFKMDEILRHLSRSSAVELRKPILGRDPIGRLFVLNGIALMLAFPKKFLVDGGLNPEDYRNFPRNLRLLIVIPSNTIAALAMLFVIFGGLGKYMDWFK